MELQFCCSHTGQNASAIADSHHTFTPCLTAVCVVQIGAPFNHWAATLFSYIRVPVTATYTVSIASDNGAMVWIDDTLVVNNTGTPWHDETFLIPTFGLLSCMYCVSCAHQRSVANHPRTQHAHCGYKHISTHTIVKVSGPAICTVLHKSSCCLVAGPHYPTSNLFDASCCWHPA